MDHVRVRFAPSPTGYLHIGGARTALFNWLFARQNQGKLILRIEDTDDQRLKEDSIDQILTSLKWLGLDWDEGPGCGGAYGPYFQSQRLGLYRQAAQRLVEEGKAYYCFCAPEELDRVRQQQRQSGEALRYSGKCRDIPLAAALQRIAAGEKAVIRLRLPQGGQITVNDIIRGKVDFRLDQLDDMILMKSNDIPAYNFACAIDDHDMAISHVIRAEEHLSNTPKQVLIYEALGYELPQFAHLSMILAPDRSKLSKRHGATSVEEFREQGFTGPAIVNYLTLLGWSPGGEAEILTMAETVEKFALDKVSKTAAIYDTKKLAWINGQYLNSLPLGDVTRAALPFLLNRGLITEEQAAEQSDTIANIVAAVRSRVKTLAELAEAAEYFFRDVTQYDEAGRLKYFAKPEAAEFLRRGRERLAQLECFGAEQAEAAYRDLAETLGVKFGELIHPARLALTGRMATPGLFDVMALLGKQRCLDRMDRAIAYIAAAKEG